MVKQFILFFGFLFGVNVYAQCEDISLKEELAMTENVAIVIGKEVVGDSVTIELIKKWKGDSIGQFLKLKYQTGLGQEFRVDTGKVYMLFWYSGFDIDRCSRSSEFKMAHFEYQLDEEIKNYKVLNVPMYDSIQYEKRNIFYYEGQKFDSKKGLYAFYDLDAEKLKSFENLPAETSNFYPRRFYLIDKNIETAKKTYELVFAVSKSHQSRIITKAQKKKILQSLFE